MADATVPLVFPPGFSRQPSTVIYKCMGRSVSSAVWVHDQEQEPIMFMVVQCWVDREVTTGYFYLRELEAMVNAAREHTESQKEGG